MSVARPLLSCFRAARLASTASQTQRRWSSTENDLSSQPPVLVLGGPNVCNINRFGIELAKAFDGEIISADVGKVYQGLTVGTQRLSLTDRQDIPHHFMDIQPLTDYLPFGQFGHEAARLCDEIISRKRLPIVVGSSVSYIRTLLQGANDTPRRDSQLEEKVCFQLTPLSGLKPTCLLLSVDQSKVFHSRVGECHGVSRNHRSCHHGINLAQRLAAL